ncbi:MAG: nucleotide exchange factor GrpE [Eubacteriales bacterium]
MKETVMTDNIKDENKDENVTDEQENKEGSAVGPEENENESAQSYESADSASYDAEQATETEKDGTDTDDDAGEDKLSRSDKKKIRKLESELEGTKKQLEAAKAELAESKDKYMRLFAEYDNFRKRSAKEKEGVYSDAYSDALTQILPVLDNLERAAACGDGDAAALSKGLQLTLKSFAETLEKMGVKEIEALGKTFDPNLHNAVMHVEDESLGENEVAEVFAKGYAKGDKVLRHSMVKVAN